MPGSLGVVGAGTMGAGIAQLGVGAGMRTLLHDPIPAALDLGMDKARSGLRKWAERGREIDDALLEAARSLDELSACELVIEAAPERLELKRELFAQLARIAPDAVLASNTSSIPITAIASASATPENVVGMHFFNPAPLMKLVEVIAADQTGEHALELARATGEAMGKRVIDATDGPGFLVNRCGRPFYTEALRLLQEQVASAEQIDRICRLGAGFRMGPFELMDLVGIDTGYEVAKSFTELSFGEPRWRPNPIQARMVAAGRLGRKTGRGYYDYSEEPYRPEDPEPLEPGDGSGKVVAIGGDTPLADGLRARARAAGYQVAAAGLIGRLSGTKPELVVEAAAPGFFTDLGDVPKLILCADATLASADIEEACGFHLLPPIDEAQLVELTRLPDTPDHVCRTAERFFAALGFHHEWVGDSTGLVLGRIVCQLVNEAAFAIGEGVGSADDVDAGLEMGLSYPRGPVAWSEAIGIPQVIETLEGLPDEDRYRLAPLLERAEDLDLDLREIEWPPPT